MYKHIFWQLQLRYCPGNKNYDGVTWEEFEDEIAHVLEELGIPRLSEMGYDKPELATNDSEVWYVNFFKLWEWTFISQYVFLSGTFYSICIYTVK